MPKILFFLRNKAIMWNDGKFFDSFGETFSSQELLVLIHTACHGKPVNHLGHHLFCTA